MDAAHMTHTLLKRVLSLCRTSHREGDLHGS
jgi:hypothetical protein